MILIKNRKMRHFIFINSPIYLGDVRFLTNFAFVKKNLT